MKPFYEDTLTIGTVEDDGVFLAALTLTVEDDLGTESITLTSDTGWTSEADAAEAAVLVLKQLVAMGSQL